MAGKRKKKRGPRWLQRLQLNLAVWAISTYVWVLRLTCRIKIVAGSQHVDAALARGVVVPCTWHQQILASALFLRGLVPSGLKTGFLVSPSRDGELTARIAKKHGTYIMRGSSSRTGSQALKAIMKGTKNGISPTMYGDGPRGPAHVMKLGTVILAQRTDTPIMAVGTAASRYWQFNSWDHHRIPKPFATINVAVGELWTVDRSERDFEAIAQKVGHKIDELTAQAEA